MSRINAGDPKINVLVRKKTGMHYGGGGGGQKKPEIKVCTEHG